MELFCDVVVIGTGPAGLQAAIHAARKKVKVVVLGKIHKSSAYNAHIENYCCIPGITGVDLIEQGRIQAQQAGAEFIDEDVISIKPSGNGFEIQTESGRVISCLAVVFAMGVSRKRLGVPGEKEFLGKGVSYCVECDANFFRNKPVAVIGCESAAVSGAFTMLFYSHEVHLICDSRLRVTENLDNQVRNSSVIIHENTRVIKILGDEKGVTGVLLDNGNIINVEGVFIELGAKGAIELAASLGVQLDPETLQFIVTNKRQETNVPGVYAAGDICGPPWQIAKAVGEGCVAGIEAASYVRKIKTAE